MNTSTSDGLALNARGGRYPYGLAYYDAREIRATARCDGDRVVIRIDDLVNLDRWEELSVAGEALRKLLDQPCDVDA